MAVGSGRFGNLAAPCLSLMAAALLAACSQVLTLAEGPFQSGPDDLSLFSADAVLQDQWQHLPLRGKTDYSLAVLDGRVAIRATGAAGASALVRRVTIDPRKCPAVEWSWAVEQLQKGADICEKEKEDVAASLYLLFGDPGLLIDPVPVPTLRYVWTNTTVPAGSVVDSPYLPGTARSLVAESGAGRRGDWVTVRRNVLKDFELAFERPADAQIHAVALFTDNDQTKQPVEAYYEWARMTCEE